MASTHGLEEDAARIGEKLEELPDVRGIEGTLTACVVVYWVFCEFVAGYVHTR